MEESRYKEYANAFSEIYYIINNSTNDVKDKIPNSFKKLVEENKSESYIVEVDVNKNLSENKLLPKTKELIYMMYRDFLCSDEEREQFIEEEKVRFDKIKEKYDIDNIFKNREKKQNEKETLPVKVEKKKWYKRILDKIRAIF